MTPSNPCLRSNRLALSGRRLAPVLASVLALAGCETIAPLASTVTPLVGALSGGKTVSGTLHLAAKLALGNSQALISEDASGLVPGKGSLISEDASGFMGARGLLAVNETLAPVTATLYISELTGAKVGSTGPSLTGAFSFPGIAPGKGYLISLGFKGGARYEALVGVKNADAKMDLDIGTTILTAYMASTGKDLNKVDSPTFLAASGTIKTSLDDSKLDDLKTPEQMKAYVTTLMGTNKAFAAQVSAIVK